jgi:hypothetical protein
VGVKRTAKKTAKKSVKPAANRSPKLPDELVPIVDAVVEVVFERLRGAVARPSSGKSAPPSRKTAKLDLPLPKQRTALAEALADLLLADLAGRARAERRKKPRTESSQPRDARARPPAKRRRAKR